jgi:hypothetical protein
VPVKIWLVLVIRAAFQLSACSISASRAHSRHLILDHSPHLPCLGSVPTSVERNYKENAMGARRWHNSVNRSQQAP